MKKFIFALFFTYILINSCVYASPEIKAHSAILATANGEQILFDKNSSQRQYPAGLTKIITALVAYEKSGMDQTVTVPDNIKDYLTQLEPTMKLKAGEQLGTGSLINGMIVGSANDAAIALAIHCSGSVETFVQQMNEKAQQLGLADTHFVNVTGNHSDEQYTTAKDMLIIMREIYKIKPLLFVLNSQNISIEATNTSSKRIFWTNNHLISRYIETKYVYKYATGGKTASSSAGGYSIVANATKGNNEFLCVVLGSTLDEGVNYSLVDATKLFEHGFNDFILKTIITQDEFIQEIKVINSSSNNYLVLNTNSTLRGYILRNDNIASVVKKSNVPPIVSAPIKQGDIIGNIEYSYMDKPIGTVNIVAANSLSLNPIKYIFNSILWFLKLKIIKVIISIIIAFMLIYITMVILTIKNQIKKTKGRD